MFVYHRFNLKDRIFAKKTAKKKAIKPVLHVPHECSPAVPEKLSKRYLLLPSNEKTAEISPLPQKKIISELHQQAASSSFAAPEPAYINDDRFFEKKQSPNRKGTIQLSSKKKKPPLD